MVLNLLIPRTEIEPKNKSSKKIQHSKFKIITQSRRVGNWTPLTIVMSEWERFRDYEELKEHGSRKQNQGNRVRSESRRHWRSRRSSGRNPSHGGRREEAFAYAIPRVIEGGQLRRTSSDAEDGERFCFPEFFAGQ